MLNNRIVVRFRAPIVIVAGAAITAVLRGTCVPEHPG